MGDLSLGEAARAIGVSVDTLRRWDRAGNSAPPGTPETADRCRRARWSGSARAQRHRTQDSFSARNRFPGTVTSVEVDGVMALVEIQAGPHLITAAITRDSVEELGLVEGARATATVKATSVMIDRSD